MRINDQFRFVRQNMKKNKSRIFMTVLAAAMGCAFLIVLASVGFGLKESVVSEVTEDRLVNEIEVYGKEVDNNYLAITLEDIEFMEQIKHVKAVTRSNWIPGNIAIVIGEAENYASNRSVHFPSELAANMELAAGEVPEKANEVLVGYDFIDRWEQDELPFETDGVHDVDSWVGQKLEIRIYESYEDSENYESIEVTISGVAKDPAKEWEYDNTVYWHEELYEEVFADQVYRSEDGQKAYERVNVIGTDLKHLKSINNVLEEHDFATYSLLNEIEQINVVFAIFNTGLIFVGTIAVLIASIGIFNTMTMAVTERTQEIGIMKAIGANPKIIKRLFLLESGFIGLMGAVIGTIVSYVISIAVNIAMPMIIEGFFDERVPSNFVFSSIPLILVIISVSISLLVAILSGARPAKKATRIEVLSALRRDI